MGGSADAMSAATGAVASASRAVDGRFTGAVWAVSATTGTSAMLSAADGPFDVRARTDASTANEPSRAPAINAPGSRRLVFRRARAWIERDAVASVVFAP